MSKPVEPGKEENGLPDRGLGAPICANQGRRNGLFASGPVFLLSGLAWAFLTWILWPEWFIRLRWLYAPQSFTDPQLYLGTAAWALVGALAVSIYIGMGRRAR